MATPLKASICGRSLAGVAGANPPELVDLSLTCECCVIRHMPATGRSLVQRSPPECGVSECDLETPTIMRPRPTRAVEPWKKTNVKRRIYRPD